MRSTMDESRRSADRVLWTVFGASVIIAIITLIVSRLTAPELPAGVGPMFPRTAAPPRSMSIDELLRIMGIGALTWYGCILSAPLFVVLARRAPFDRRRWPASLVAHLIVIVVLVLATSFLQHALTYAGAPSKPPLATYLQAALVTGFLPFVAVAAAVHALDARGRERARDLEAARIQAQLAEARLAALAAQLQPHFLFNTLQAISALIPRDPSAADRMLTSLSDLLRDVLRRGDTREVTLGEELAVLEPYLEISRMRFGARLSIVITVDDDSRRALVPFFVLQPLVENALAHGIGAHAGAGCVTVRGFREGDRLVVLVADDGRAEGGRHGEGIGLPNTRARLRELYGDAQSLELVPRVGGGTEVRMLLPWREVA
jgi:uncharacterized integral membrane protein